MKWEQVRAPAAKPKSAPLFGMGDHAPRRYLPAWLPFAAGGALLILVIGFFVATRKPAAPEPLRPNRPSAASPAPGREYRSDNVIIRFPQTPADQIEARR